MRRRRGPVESSCRYRRRRHRPGHLVEARHKSDACEEVRSIDRSLGVSPWTECAAFGRLRASVTSKKRRWDAGSLTDDTFLSDKQSSSFVSVWPGSRHSAVIHSQIVLLVIPELFHLDVVALNHGSDADTQLLDLTATYCDPCTKTSMVRVGKVASVGNLLDAERRFGMGTNRVVS